MSFIFLSELMVERLLTYYYRHRRKSAFILFDLIAFTLSVFFAFLVQKDFRAALPSNIAFVLVIALIIKFGVYYMHNLYNIAWRFVSLHDLANIIKATVISSTALFIVFSEAIYEGFAPITRTTLLIDFFVTLVLTSGIRISKRMVSEVIRAPFQKQEALRTLIIGAGMGGEQILREITRGRQNLYNPVGFIDDDVSKHNLQLQGLGVLGTTHDLPSLIKQLNINAALLAIPSADRNIVKRIYRILRSNGVSHIKVLSTINDVANVIKTRVQDIRDLDVTDLIGRQAIKINTNEILSLIEGKSVLITGAAGSIGSEIAKQVMLFNPSRLILLDINESDLADMHIKLQKEYPKKEIEIVLCDISDQSAISRLVMNVEPDIIFHAAAYKHVPVMEKFPEQAVKVNILGTYYLAQAARAAGVSQFVQISTDKAVNPTSIMGASKRIAEYIVTGFGAEGDTEFVVVRFGNVIGSRGSALPIFIEQMNSGGPITVTHPEMKRYFMTIPEAVSLVLQAFATGKNGDVLVLDMGEQVKILDLVHELISLNGMEVGKDISIEIIGIREGEKLYEEVLTAEEGVIATCHEKIFKTKLSYILNEKMMHEMIRRFSQQVPTASKQEWQELFKNFIPTYNYTISYGDIKHNKESVSSIIS